MRISERAIGLLSTMVLARLLVPADFGLVAMGTVILAILEAMTAFGFEWAIIQRGTRERRFLDTAWSLNLLLGAICAIILCLAVPLATHIYSEPRVAGVLYVLALSSLIGGMRNIGMVIFERDLNFKPVFLTALASKLVGLSVTLTIAHFHPTHWALLGGMLSSRLADLAMSFAIQPYRPRWSLSATRELFGFSGWLLLTNMLFFLSNRGADLVVGSRAGSGALGAYSVSYELANLPTTELVQPIMRAAFPGYSRLNERPAELSALFLKVLGLVSLFALPAAAGLASLSLPIVLVVLGDRWLDAASLIGPLALFGGIRAVQGTTGSVYMALGKPHLSAVLSGLYVLLGLGTFTTLLVLYSLEAAAWGLVAATGMVALANVTLISRELALSIRSIFAVIVRPLLAATLMAGVLAHLPTPQWIDNAWGWRLALLIAMVAAGAITYFLALVTAWAAVGCPDGAERTASALVRERLSNVRKTA